MAEFIPPSEANAPDLVMREEVLRYVEGLNIGDIRFTVFHDHSSVYNAQAQIFEFEELLETARGSDRIGHESDKRVAEMRYAVASARQEDRRATVSGYEAEYRSLARQYDHWIHQYEELEGVDFSEAQEVINSIIRFARHQVLERAVLPHSNQAEQ
jgi:hypothetical protein